MDKMNRQMTAKGSFGGPSDLRYRTMSSRASHKDLCRPPRFSHSTEHFDNWKATSDARLRHQRTLSDYKVASEVLDTPHINANSRRMAELQINSCCMKPTVIIRSAQFSIEDDDYVNIAAGLKTRLLVCETEESLIEPESTQDRNQIMFYTGSTATNKSKYCTEDKLYVRTRESTCKLLHKQNYSKKNSKTRDNPELLVGRSALEPSKRVRGLHYTQLFLNKKEAGLEHRSP